MTAGAALSRPRIQGERADAILDCAVELVLELGYDRLTMDAVAKRARASKATLYRRWESKASLVVDALGRAKASGSVRIPDTGSLRGDLLATYCGHHDSNKVGTGVLGSVITALATDSEFAELFREQFVEQRVAAAYEIYRRARDRGEISPETDIEMIGPALAAILLHRTFILGEPPDDATVERIVDSVILPAARFSRLPVNERDGAGAGAAPSR